MTVSVAHEVSTDTEAVCEEAELGLECCAVLPDLDKGLLHDVVREISVVGLEQRLPEDDRLVALKKDAEGFSVRALYSLEKQNIGRGGIHGGVGYFRDKI